jgi:hypothetical protein
MKRTDVGNRYMKKAFSRLLKDMAGLTNPKTSLTINGIEQETEISIAT